MPKKKLRLEDVALAHAALSQLGNSKRIGLELQWEMEDLRDVLEKHTKRYGQEARKLLEEYGEEIPTQKGRYRVPRENQDMYNDEIDKLNNVQVTIDFEPLKFSKLVENEINFVGSELSALKKDFIVRDGLDNGEKKKPKKEAAEADA